MDYIIIQKISGCEALPKLTYIEPSTPLRDSLYTFPAPVLFLKDKTGAGLGSGLPSADGRWGFPEFTSFFNSPYDEKLPLTASRSTTELPRSETQKL